MRPTDRERERERETHTEARCSVQQLDHVSDAGLGGLRELLLLQLLHHVEHYVLAGEERASLKHLEDQLQRFFLHDGAKELAASTANG